MTDKTRIDIIAQPNVAQVFVNGKSIPVNKYELSQEPGKRPSVNLEVPADVLFVHDSFSEAPLIHGLEEIQYSDKGKPGFTVSLTADQIEHSVEYAMVRSLEVFDNKSDKRWYAIDEKLNAIVNDRADDAVSKKTAFAYFATFSVITGFIVALVSNLISQLL